MKIVMRTTNDLFNLSEIFGAFFEEVPKLLQAVKKLKLDCVEVAFHVWTGDVKLEAYKCSLEDSSMIFNPKYDKKFS